jgi:hypothetical protein
MLAAAHRAFETNRHAHNGFSKPVAVHFRGRNAAVTVYGYRRFRLVVRRKKDVYAKVSHPGCGNNFLRAYGPTHNFRVVILFVGDPPAAQDWTVTDRGAGGFTLHWKWTEPIVI